MQKSTGSYEKVILTLAALVAVAVSAWLVTLSRGFDDSLVLPAATPRNQMNPPDTQGVSAAIATISKKYSWVSPVINGKAVPLNKSILLVRKGAEIFDLFVAEPKFRPPMTNLFVAGDKTKDPPEEELPNLFSPNIGMLDADSDGFTNEEEFNGGTNPRDDKSMPPLTNKLFLKQRIANDYILQLKSGDEGGSPSFQIRRVKPEPARNVFAGLNADFGFDKGVNRFVILSFSKKKITHPTLGEIDAYVVKMKDNATQGEFELVQGEEKNLAEYEAQFEFRWKRLEVIPNVKKGKVFQLPGVGKSFMVREIEETKAVISPIDEGTGQAKSETIEISQN
jgi:hypothetical protein